MRLAVWVGVVAVLSAGGRADAQEKKPDVVTKLDGHRGGVSAIAFHPRVSYVVTGAGNGVTRVWEAKTGDLAVRLEPQRPGPGSRINHLGFVRISVLNIDLLSTSSRNSVLVWNLTPPALPKKDPNEPKLPELKDEQPRKEGPREIPVIFDDGVGNDPVKIGTITGDARRVYFSTTEGVRVGINSRPLFGQGQAETSDELKGAFTPWAISAMPDTESGLVALYGSMKAADKTEQPAVAFVGLGNARVIARRTVPAPIAGRPATIAFAPDGKWLVACNGEELMYWKVPGSQVVEGDPKIVGGALAYAAAAGPNGRVAYASPPEEGKKVKVTIVDVTAAQPKTLAVYATEIDRVSVLAFSPDGLTLAVGDDTEGVVQLWNLAEKK